MSLVRIQHHGGGRGRTFESCRAHGSTKPFSKARNAEKCAIRPSYSASAATGEAEEPCPERAGSEGYWDSLTEAQEVWALRKMGYFKIGERR